MENIINNGSTQIMEVENAVVEVIEQTLFMWYGHLRKMKEGRQWKPDGRIRRGKPKKNELTV